MRRREATDLQAIERTAPVLPLRPGRVERHTHDCVRHGTTDLVAALDVRAGTAIGARHPRHRGVEFRRFLATIEANVPAAPDVPLVPDKASIHETAPIRDWLAKRPRYHLHSTPTSSASWLDLVERWFVLLTARQLRRGVFRSTHGPEQAIRAYIAATNEPPKPFAWTKTADEILASVARFCQSTYNSIH